ncbi:MAG: hypothetical protein ACLQOO_31855 [Terriglobia bacterium]
MPVTVKHDGQHPESAQGDGGGTGGEKHKAEHMLEAAGAVSGSCGSSRAIACRTSRTICSVGSDDCTSNVEVEL